MTHRLGKQSHLAWGPYTEKVPNQPVGNCGVMCLCLLGDRREVGVEGAVGGQVGLKLKPVRPWQPCMQTQRATLTQSDITMHNLCFLI